LWPNRVKRFDVKYAVSGGSFVKYGFTVALIFDACLVLIFIVVFVVIGISGEYRS